MRILSWFVFTILLVSLSGCVSPDKSMRSWLGRPAPELIASWGPPQQKYPDGQGGEIWIYQTRREWTTPGQANTTVNANANTYGTLTGNTSYYPNSSAFSGSYVGNTSVCGTASTTYTPPQTHGYTANRSFFVNADGTIYRYAWQGY